MPLSGYGPVVFVNRLVRTRMLGGVGRGGEQRKVIHFVNNVPNVFAQFANACLICPSKTNLFFYTNAPDRKTRVRDTNN